MRDFCDGGVEFSIIFPGCEILHSCDEVDLGSDVDKFLDDKESSGIIILVFDPFV